MPRGASPERSTPAHQSLGGKLPSWGIDAGAPRLRVTAEQMELSKLHKEVQELKMEQDILKNAPRGAYFTRS